MKANDTAQASAERRPRDRRGPAEAPRLPRAVAADDEVARRGRRPPDAGAAEPRRVGAADHGLLRRLGPFAQASRPAIRSLGQASVTGDSAVEGGGADGRAARRRRAGHAGGRARTSRSILGHLDDRKYAIEKDPRSPGGQGYTGLEALLQYVYDQTTSTATTTEQPHLQGRAVRQRVRELRRRARPSRTTRRCLRSAARSSARTSPGSRPRTSRASRTRGRTPPATSRGGAATRPRRRSRRPRRRCPCRPRTAPAPRTSPPRPRRPCRASAAAAGSSRRA